MYTPKVNGCSLCSLLEVIDEHVLGILLRIVFGVPEDEWVRPELIGVLDLATGSVCVL